LSNHVYPFIQQRKNFYETERPDSSNHRWPWLNEEALLNIAQEARLFFTGDRRRTLNVAIEELGAGSVTLPADVLDSEARKDVFAAIKKNFDGAATRANVCCLAISSTDRRSKSTIIS
jgi:hypothetical protein